MQSIGVRSQEADVETSLANVEVNVSFHAHFSDARS